MKTFKKIVITGGAGFIGSHVVDAVAETYPDSHIVVYDKMTYAAHVDNLKDQLFKDNVRLMVGDLCDVDQTFHAVEHADLVIHLAAESHVDNSFKSALLFTHSNVVGTHTLVEACHNRKVPFFIHVSTDEVYGEVLTDFVDETAMLKPTNPYSASKAGAEMIISGFRLSYDFPVLMVRANNVYGPRQYPEKLVPRSTMNLIHGRKILLHGNGQNRRHFLAGTDFAKAILLLIEKGTIGETYNVGSDEEYMNIEVASMIASQFGMSPDEAIEFVPDRPFNDRRYAIKSDKIRNLGWSPSRSLKNDIPDIVEWYKVHGKRFEEF